MSIDMTHIKRLFMLLHGMYGNQLLDKFRTGDLNEGGEDKGMLSAQTVWLSGLKEFDFEVIRKAVARCEIKHKTFPPSLPEFRDLCRSCQPARFSRPQSLQLPMSDELKAHRRAENRQLLAELKVRAAQVTFGDGLPALLGMIAKAVGDAGGNEVKKLMLLESTFCNRGDAQ